MGLEEGNTGAKFVLIVVVLFVLISGEVVATSLSINITSPPNATISDTTPNLNFTMDETVNATYNWDGDGNISGCRDCTSFNTTYGESVLDANTSLLLHFNEHMRNMTFDDSSNGNNGTLGNSSGGNQPAWSTAGRFGNALSFDGSSDFVNVADDDSLDFSLSDSFTVEAWIKTDFSGAGQYIVAKVDTVVTNWSGYHLTVDKYGKAWFMVHDTTKPGGSWPSNLTSTKSVNGTGWHHVAAVRDTSSGVLRLYIDGVEDANATDSTSQSSANSVPLRVGTHPDVNKAWFNGTIDDVHIIRRALSATEIADIYDKTISDGLHNVTVYAIDNAGNLNSTTRWFTVTPNINITSPPNKTITDTTPNLNLTTYEQTNITYSWDGEANISGCRNCNTYSTAYGENNGSDPNTVLLMHMNENYDTTAYDEVSNNDGGINNAIWSTGRFGPALDFDETGGYVEVPDDASIDFNAETDSFTITTWVNVIGATGTSQYVVNKQNEVGFNPGYHVFLNKTGVVRFMVHTTAGSSDYGVIKGAKSLLGTGWHNIAAVYDASADAMDIYVDGNSDGATVNYAPTASSLNNESLFIGAHDPVTGKYLNGSIDEFAIYDRALSAAEVQELYSKALPLGQHSVTVRANDTMGNLDSTTRWFTVLAASNIIITSPANDTIIDTTPDLNLTTDKQANITYSWDGEGNISGCRNCTSYNTTYGENNGSDAGLVALWHFNEDFNNLTFDDSGNGNNATLGNATAGTQPTWTAGKFGHALEFDGSSDFVNVSDSSSLDISGDISVSAWINFMDVNTRRVVLIKTEEYLIRVESGTDKNEIAFFLYDGTDWEPRAMTSAAKTPNTWHHVVGTWNRSTGNQRIYVDGYLKGEVTHSLTPTPTTNPLTLGRWTGGASWFNGTIDEVAIYNRTLSAAEIYEMYTKSLSKDLHNVTVYANDSDGGLSSTTRLFTIGDSFVTQASYRWRNDDEAVVTYDPTPRDDKLWTLDIDSDYIYIAATDFGGANHTIRGVNYTKQWRVEKRYKSNLSVVWTVASDPGVDEVVPGGADDIIVDSDYVYVSGWDNNGDNSSHQWRIEKRNIIDGSLVWNVSSDPTDRNDVPDTLTIDSDYIYVAGVYNMTGINHTGRRWRIEKRNIIDGSLVWNVTIPYTGSELPSGSRVDSDYLYLGGYETNASDSSMQLRIEKRNKTDGSSVWNVTSNPSNGTDKVTDLGIDSDFVYIAAYDSARDVYQWRIEKRSIIDGSLVWNVTFDPSNDTDIADILDVDSDFVYVAGYDRAGSDGEGGQSYEWRIEKRSIIDGSLVWNVTSDLTMGNDRAKHVSVDSTYMYVGGWDNGGDNSSLQWRIEKRSIIDGSLSATWKAGENAAFTGQGKKENIRVRFSIKNNGSMTNGYNYRLQVAPKGGAANCEDVSSGSFSDIPTVTGGCSSAVACMNASAYFDNQDSTIRELSIPDSFTFVSGKMVEDPSNQTDAITLDTDDFTEVEYNFYFTNNASGAYCSRVTNAGADLDDYANVATITDVT